MSNFLLEYSRQKLSELHYNTWNYETSVRLVEVSPGAKVELNSNNDIFFFANAYTTGSTPIDAKIIGENMAMQITPAVNQTLYYKHQFYFTGEIKITNVDSVNTLFIELLVITPLQNK